MTPQQIRDLVAQVDRDGWNWDAWLKTFEITERETITFGPTLAERASRAPDWSSNISASAALLPPGWWVIVTVGVDGAAAVTAYRMHGNGVTAEAPEEALARWKVGMLARATLAEEAMQMENSQ